MACLARPSLCGLFVGKHGWPGESSAMACMINPRNLIGWNSWRHASCRHDFIILECRSTVPDGFGADCLQLMQPNLTCWLALQAIRLASTDARDLVPRLLQLLMVEPRGAETLGRAIAQKAVDLPGWIWLPWIPQLMTSLQRPEVAVSRRILSAAASSFPQQMYWHVRPSMLAMKDAAVKAVQDAKAQVTMAVSSGASLFHMAMCAL